MFYQLVGLHRPPLLDPLPQTLGVSNLEQPRSSLVQCLKVSSSGAHSETTLQHRRDSNLEYPSGALHQKPLLKTPLPLRGSNSPARLRALNSELLQAMTKHPNQRPQPLGSSLEITAGSRLEQGHRTRKLRAASTSE